MTEIQGSCHCGALRFGFQTDRAVEDLPLRRCGCGFCRRHGGFYTSDPQGRLVIEAAADALTRYRFGQETAEFLICRHCGVFVAVTAEIENRLFAVVNLAAAEPALVPPLSIPIMDFDGESVAERTARRQRNWIGSVEIHDAR